MTSYPNMNSPDRDSYDHNLDNYYTELATQSQGTTNMDNNWKQNKIDTIRLNEQIQNRKSNYNTYTSQIEMQKELYNREYNKTILFAVSNAIALIGCIYVWRPKSE